MTRAKLKAISRAISLHHEPHLRSHKCHKQTLKTITVQLLTPSFPRMQPKWTFSFMGRKEIKVPKGKTIQCGLSHAYAINHTGPGTCLASVMISLKCSTSSEQFVVFKRHFCCNSLVLTMQCNLWSTCFSSLTATRRIPPSFELLMTHYSMCQPV